MLTPYSDSDQTPSEWVSRVIETCGILPQALSRLQDARDTHSRLIAYQGQLERKSSEVSGKEGDKCAPEGDNFLRGEVMDTTRTERIHRSDRVALSYWRHGESCACRVSKSEEFTDRLHPRSAYKEQLNCLPSSEGDLNQPGMGLEMDCFTSFLANSAKEQFLHDYQLQSSLASRQFFQHARSPDDVSTEALLTRLDRGLELARSALAQLAKRKTSITAEISEVLRDHFYELRGLANQLRVVDNCDVGSEEQDNILVSMEQMQSEWNKYFN